MVRPGGLVFGCLPFARAAMPAALHAIKSCMSIKAKVAYYKSVPAGAGISYNHTHIIAEKSNIITIPVGYGDGLRRSLSNNGSILHNGKRYPIVGQHLHGPIHGQFRLRSRLCRRCSHPYGL